jgi:trehalose 6-phosphate synthase
VSRLVVVSNRVTPVTGARAATAGGLAVGVHAALRETGGIWFGWSGDVTPVSAAMPKVFRTGRITYATVDLSKAEFDGYYGGFANRTLWPLCHYRLDLTSFEHAWYATYRRVNQLFAEHLAPYLRDDDLIWIHDYHLIPMGEELRRLGVRARIGFFLHIPWPSSEIYVALPWHEALARALSAYDLVGFQTALDERNFADYVLREAGGRVETDGRLRAFGRSFRAASFPIGIDAEDFAQMAQSADAERRSRKLKQSLSNRDLIIGVDRLDYTKGILERLRAYELLLASYPEHRGRISFVQISAPSREDVPEYLDLRHDVEQTSGRINGRFSEFDWVPLQYINRSFPRRTLAGFFRISRIGYVTPLRDGMNLVAKEYVAAQDPADPGVLVLSRFAGAAGELDGALVVNPFDVEAVAEAVHAGLVMPQDERRDRFERMILPVRRHDVTAWRIAFVQALADPAEAGRRAPSAA